MATTQRKVWVVASNYPEDAALEDSLGRGESAMLLHPDTHTPEGLDAWLPAADALVFYLSGEPTERTREIFDVAVKHGLPLQVRGDVGPRDLFVQQAKAYMGFLHRLVKQYGDAVGPATFDEVWSRIDADTLPGAKG